VYLIEGIRSKICKSFKNYWQAVKFSIISFTDQFKCDGTRAETRFRLSAKRTSSFKLAGASVPSTTSSWGVHISGSNAGYTMFWSSVKGTCYPLHSPVTPSPPLPCVTVCHHISTGIYLHRFVLKTFIRLTPYTAYLLLYIYIYVLETKWRHVC